MSVPQSVNDGRTTTSKSDAFDAWAPLEKLSEAAASWLLDTVMTDESVCFWGGLRRGRWGGAERKMGQIFTGMRIILFFIWGLKGQFWLWISRVWLLSKNCPKMRWEFDGNSPSAGGGTGGRRKELSGSTSFGFIDTFFSFHYCNICKWLNGVFVQQFSDLYLSEVMGSTKAVELRHKPPESSISPKRPWVSLTHALTHAHTQLWIWWSRAVGWGQACWNINGGEAALWVRKERPGWILMGGSTGGDASARTTHVFSILDLLVVLVEVLDALLKVYTLPLDVAPLFGEVLPH